MAMRKLGSILVIMLLLIAYGRCVSDQFGMLHTSDASCCQTICTAVTHCSDVAEACHDHSDSEDNDHNNEEKPAPCQLCFILDNDSIMIQDGIKIPSPTLANFIPIFDFGTDLDLLFSRTSGLTSTDFQLEDLPDPPAELCSLYLSLVTKTAPVRGPSIA